jgi:hypothetical protein
VVARPAGTLEARTFLAATRAACTSAQLVAGSIWSPSDDSDRASKRRVVLAALTPQPHTHGVDRCSSPSVGRGQGWRMAGNSAAG